MAAGESCDLILVLSVSVLSEAPFKATQGNGNLLHGGVRPIKGFLQRLYCPAVEQFVRESDGK